MKLKALQRTMARAVMQPLTLTERMQRVAPDGRPMRAYAARFIKPNDRLTSFERLEIYNRQYWFRLLSSMVEDFPGLRAVLGSTRFEAMCKAYITDCPSRSFTLRNLGSQLEGWLHKHPRWAGKKQALALDIVKLEWAEIEAFDGKAEPPLRAEDLAAAGGASGFAPVAGRFARAARRFLISSSRYRSRLCSTSYSSVWRRTLTNVQMGSTTRTTNR